MKTKPLIAILSPVSITAQVDDDQKDMPCRFAATFYTGGSLDLEGWSAPVVVDLAGLRRGNVLVANLDHDRTKRVGNFELTNDGKSLSAQGLATAATAARDEVVNSAKAGYQWQASLEVRPDKIEEVKAGKSVVVNGQTLAGPLYVARSGVLKGFAFVSHGADDNTTVSIAAKAASHGGKLMKAEVKAWIEKMLPSVDIDSLSDEEKSNLEADYDGRERKQKRTITANGMDLGSKIDDKKSEHERISSITEIALTACDRRPYDIDGIKSLAEQAIEGKWSVDKFRLELLEASLPPAHTVFRTRRDERLTGRLLEAAICQAGRIDNIEKHFDEQTLQVAHDRFKGRIGLKQLFLLCAQANGHHESAMDVTRDVHNAAFGYRGPQLQASGFSTIDISTIISNVANKFIMRGWNMVDQTCLQVAKIQSVRDFKTATTVSLTDSVIYEKIGADGEIKHGTLGELSYTVRAETYARMLAITRQDIINDDLGALTDVPMRLGNGAIKKLNDIFWTEFLGLVGASFFASGNSNINTGVATMTEAGLDATYVIFKNQTNPDGTPLGVEPRIILVPTALEGAALRLMRSENFITGSTTTQGATNIWANRFKVLSSPYISNSSYTGYTSVAWWLLADPNELPVIAIAALNGRVEPTVDTADAEFNVLGVQMRGYSDIGVSDQEYRGGVHADGGAS